jgi:hypothetical protein
MRISAKVPSSGRLPAELGIGQMTAVATSRASLNVAVLVLPLRHPVELAKGLRQ